MKCLPVILLAVFLSACQPLNPIDSSTLTVDRQQRASRMVGESALRSGGKEAYDALLAAEKIKGNVNADPKQTARVRLIAKRLIEQTTILNPNASTWSWEVNVLRVDEPTAFCLPGGKIAIYSALLHTEYSLTDDELAAVLAHTIAHDLLAHGRERATDENATGLAQMAWQVTVLTPHSRLHEQEADRLAAELSARAGYDPRAAIALWQKLNKLANSKQMAFLSSHPLMAGRMQDLSNFGQRSMPLFEAARRR
jgi:predicted Zn-dependent protease